MASMKHLTFRFGKRVQLSPLFSIASRFPSPVQHLLRRATIDVANPSLTTPTTPFLRWHSTRMVPPYDDDPFPDVATTAFSQMSNEELQDTSTIPGWDLIHSPPRKFPRGALVGSVVSDKMDKTVNVAVTRYRIVPKIRKRIRYTRKFMAHDEHEVANMGDTVMITPCHRISKNKHFMLREIIRPKGQL